MIEERSSPCPEIFRGVTADWEAIAERFGVSVQELAARLEEAGGTPEELLGQLAAFGVDLGKFERRAGEPSPAVVGDGGIDPADGLRRVWRERLRTRANSPMRSPSMASRPRSSQ